MAHNILESLTKRIIAMEVAMQLHCSLKQEWLLVSSKFLNLFKKDRDYKLSFDILEFRNHTQMNPQ